jgi:hypothetical protein
MKPTKQIWLDTRPAIKLKELRGLIVHYTAGRGSGNTAGIYKKVWEDSSVIGVGAHYAIDEFDLVQYVPEDEVVYHSGARDYKEPAALFENSPNNYTVGIEICITKGQDYSKIEKRAIQFCGDFLSKYNLTTDSMFRHFDMTGKACPLQYIESAKWLAFISEVNKYMLDKDVSKITNIYEEEAFNTFIDGLTDDRGLIDLNKADFMKTNSPDIRGVEALTGTEGESSPDATPAIGIGLQTPTNLISTESVNANVLTEGSNTDSVPGLHCNRAFNINFLKVDSDMLYVEPMYPDYIVPPTSSSGIFNDEQETEHQIFKESLIPSVEDYERRQKIFNPKEYIDETTGKVKEEAVKKDRGKPVNNNDPYPVDEKIYELEKHLPRIKIDDMSIRLVDCNHPGCGLGKSTYDNLKVITDAMVTQSKRIEKRMVQMENITSTMLRYLFRMGSRMNVNCVYYGGQDVFGKYKSIRCTHADLVHDGQSMTLDQCLNCSRYEPIIGQIYDILDESGMNLASVMDDIQASYSNMEEYINMTRLEEMNSPKISSNLKNDPKEPPKSFKEIWPPGQVMNWEEELFDTQVPDIQQYEYERIEGMKEEYFMDNQRYGDGYTGRNPIHEGSFTNSYGIDQVTSGNSGFSDVFSNTGSDIRDIIVEFAKSVEALNEQGKASYSQKHAPGAIVNGITYYDCSGLVMMAYKAANITVPRVSWQQAEAYKNGGKLIYYGRSPAEYEKAVKEALPGDIFLQDTKLTGKVSHVGIYIGNGKNIESNTDDAPIREQMNTRDVNTTWKREHFKGFVRVPELVKADAQASTSTGAVLSGMWNIDSHKLGNVYLDDGKSMKSRASLTITNMKSQNYKNSLIQISQRNGIAPLVALSVACTESNGNHNINKDGVMQYTHKDWISVEENLDLGIKIIKSKGDSIKSSSMMHALYAYNAGQGVYLGVSSSGLSSIYKTYGVTQSQLDVMTAGEFIDKYYYAQSGKLYKGQSKPRSCYFTRVLFAYNFLYDMLVKEGEDMKVWTKA